MQQFNPQAQEFVPKLYFEQIKQFEEHIININKWIYDYIDSCDFNYKFHESIINDSYDKNIEQIINDSFKNMSQEYKNSSEEPVAVVKAIPEVNEVVEIESINKNKKKRNRRSNKNKNKNTDSSEQSGQIRRRTRNRRSRKNKYQSKEKIIVQQPIKQNPSNLSTSKSYAAVLKLNN